MEKTKEQRIEEELKRISVWFESMDENQRAVLDPIMQNSAFMKVTLDDLQEIINQEGVIDRYQNGANQYGMKQSATLQSYNSLVKNYAAVNKTLFSVLPRYRRPVQPKQEETEEERDKRQQLELIRDQMKQARINAEIAAASEMQKKQWAEEGRPVS